MKKNISVLVVEDSEDDTLLLARELMRGGYVPFLRRVDNAEDMRIALGQGNWDVVISDHSMPGFDSFAALEVRREMVPDTPFIIVSGVIGEDVAVKAMKAGANDYIMKGNLTRLVPAIEREMKEEQDRRLRARIQERLGKLNDCLLSLGADPGDNISRVVESGKNILNGELILYERQRTDRPVFSSFSSSIEHPGLDLSKVQMRMKVEPGESRGPVAIEDLDEGQTLVELGPGIRECGFKSLLMHPVQLMGEEVGRLSLFDSRKREFHKDSLEFMGVLTKVLSIEEERWAREQELKDFIAIASHELRHPISVIKGYVNILEGHWEQLDKEKKEELLSDIESSADRLTGLVTELLDTSSIERGRLEVYLGDANLEALIGRAVEQMREKGAANTFNVRVADDIGDVSMDSVRMGQVVLHLLENAVNNSPEGSTVDIGAGREEEDVVVSVLDRGRGVPEEDRDKIFNRFYYVGDVEHHSIPGIGLGLYISRRVVEAHGGRIWYEPREGGGSVFTFIVPVP